MNVDRVARALGWFSIGLGAAEVLFPGRLGRALGVKGHKGIVRAFGVRELVAGAGILRRRASPRSGWLWARLAGDVMDISALYVALPKSKRRGRIAAAMAAVAAVGILDMLSGARLSKRHDHVEEPEVAVESEPEMEAAVAEAAPA